LRKLKLYAIVRLQNIEDIQLKITESIHYLIRKNIAGIGYSLNNPVVDEVLKIHNVEDLVTLLKTCLYKQTTEKNAFDLIQYVGDCMQADFDDYDVRHKATALMCHLYDHCWNTSGVLGTDVLDLFVLQSYMIIIDDQEYIQEWLAMVNVLVEYIQSVDYLKNLDDHPSATFTNSLRSNFSIHVFPLTDCSKFDFEFWGDFNCVNETEKARLTSFFKKYYPGLERGLHIMEPFTSDTSDELSLI
jgi:hypothetical protein